MLTSVSCSVLYCTMLSKRQRQLLRLLLIKRLLIRRQMKRQRRWWIRPFNQLRKQKGDYKVLIGDLISVDPQLFHVYFRMTPKQFEDLVALVAPKLIKGVGRESISPREMLAVTLKFMAHGGTMSSIAINFRLGRSTVNQIIHKTTTVLWEVLNPIYMPIPDKQGWEDIMNQFWLKWQFPLCLGSVDGKHINLKAPPLCGSTFFNYKNTNSIVLMAITDSNYCFILVNVGASGRQSDGGVYSNSDIGKAIENGSLNIPTEGILPNTQHKTFTSFVADEAFPLKTTMLRPFPGQNITEEQKIFNYRLSRARRTVENSFGILAARWRFLLIKVEMLPNYAGNAVKAATVLHNYIMKSGDNQQNYCPTYLVDSYNADGTVVPGLWRSELQHFAAQRNQYGGNRGSKLAMEHRNEINKYLCSNEGAVQWQWDTVRRGLKPI